MSRNAIRPSTLDGIKRLANSLKREQGTSHLAALDEAARVAGFQNFRHARNVLGATKTSHRSPAWDRVYITSYWNDQAGHSGRETLTVSLSAQLPDLAVPTVLQNHRAFVHFYLEGPDHLAEKVLRRAQSEARRSVCTAARALQFICATKLRPSSGSSRVGPAASWQNGIPGRDHVSTWYDPATKRYLLVDEPYDLAVAGLAQEREAWAAKHQFVVEKPVWPGMYAPDRGSRLYLVSHATTGIPLEPLVAALNRLPTPAVEGCWDGESAPVMPFFVSPGRGRQVN